jgi:hypothetical protein
MFNHENLHLIFFAFSNGRLFLRAIMGVRKNQYLKKQSLLCLNMFGNGKATTHFHAYS